MDPFEFGGKVLEALMVVAGTGGVAYALRKGKGEKVSEDQARAQVTASDDAELVDARSADWGSLVRHMQGQLQTMQQRIDAQDLRLSTQDRRIGQLERELSEERRKTWTWEWWHQRELTPNWDELRQRDEVPDPPFPVSYQTPPPPPGWGQDQDG